MKDLAFALGLIAIIVAVLTESLVPALIVTAALIALGARAYLRNRSRDESRLRTR